MSHEVTTVMAKAYIFVARQARIADLQRCFCINYNAAVALINALEAEALLEPMNEQGERRINWHHASWRSIARQPELWQGWMLKLLEGAYLIEERDDQWHCIHEIFGQQHLVASFASQEEALAFLLNH